MAEDILSNEVMAIFTRLSETLGTVPVSSNEDADRDYYEEYSLFEIVTNSFFTTEKEYTIPLQLNRYTELPEKAQRLLFHRFMFSLELNFQEQLKKQGGSLEDVRARLNDIWKGKYYFCRWLYPDKYDDEDFINVLKPYILSLNFRTKTNTSGYLNCILSKVAWDVLHKEHIAEDSYDKFFEISTDSFRQFLRIFLSEIGQKQLTETSEIIQAFKEMLAFKGVIPLTEGIADKFDVLFMYTEGDRTSLLYKGKTSQVAPQRKLFLKILMESYPEPISLHDVAVKYNPKYEHDAVNGVNAIGNLIGQINHNILKPLSDSLNLIIRDGTNLVLSQPIVIMTLTG